MRGLDVFSLELDGLCVSYGKVPVLHDVSLKVTKGQVVTIIGANGAGKSTVMKVVMGLHKATSGSVRLFGKDVLGKSPDQLTPLGMTLVPEGRRLFAPMTVRENLEMGAYRRTSAPEVQADFEKVLEFFPDLKPKLDLTAGSLSGGQQQMVAVARALMTSPKVMLLDEPTIGLAPAVVDVIAGVIRQVSNDGVDVLLVEQNAEMALEISDYGYVLEQGRIVLEAPASELASNPEVQKAYLGI
ncbi:ABC transporter ATP-binding protein [Orrella marina]|uniref:ABC transporter ATP-binding protein n=1 Tax=Orrella marina TaxID=2163011 RepID=A0A2R4XGG5_9BURK|nr:ABC transporter ATP-binding protein [Orrella marina]AWB32916.1 ABC transporter ATP-binding protein [Orrella marina]